MNAATAVPVESTSTTRTQRRAAANRRAVLDAAREIVASHGVESLTLEAVADRADVAVQTIYNRVGGRSALLMVVAEQALEEGRTYIDAAYEAQGDVEDRLLLVADAYARFARERPQEFRIIAEPPNEPDAVRRIAELTVGQNARVANVIREGMQAGIVRPDLDPDEIATALWATLNGLLALAWRPGDLHASPEAIDRLLATYIAFVSDGLRPRHA